jgi:hypothetical protein
VVLVKPNHTLDHVFFYQGTEFPTCTYAFVDPVAVEGELQAQARIGQKGQEVVGQALQLRQGAAVHEGLTHHEERGKREDHSQVIEFTQTPTCACISEHRDLTA